LDSLGNTTQTEDKWSFVWE